MTKTNTLAEVVAPIVEEQNQLEKVLPLVTQKRWPKKKATAPINLEDHREEIEEFLQRRKDTA